MLNHGLTQGTAAFDDIDKIVAGSPEENLTASDGSGAEDWVVSSFTVSGYRYVLV